MDEQCGARSLVQRSTDQRKKGRAKSSKALAAAATVKQITAELFA